MKVVIEPVQEEQVLRPVSEDADTDEILASMVIQSECCVVHLCGCKN
jgi:hypothetical protein